MHDNPIVLTGRNNIFTVLAGETRYLCRLKGKTLDLEERAYNPLAPGDEVAIAAMDETNATAVITDRLPRRNAFQRYNRKREALQTIAANVDLVVVVMSASHPDFRHRFVDRVLALSEFHGIPALVAVTKCDIDPEGARDHAACYERIGYPVTLLRTDEPERLEQLRTALRAKRAVFVGQSGVGKSTVLNGLLGEALQATGEISGKFRRGRHTTTAALLVMTDELEVIDTPGIRELDCRHVPLDELDHAFREFRPLLGSCEMSGCTHLHEPGCAVETAVGDGALDARRYQSYLRLFEELEGLNEDGP